MLPEPALRLQLVLEPERPPSLVDVSDVFRSVADAFLASDWAVRLPHAPDARDMREMMWRLGSIADGDAPLTVERFRFGSPFDLLAALPWSAVGAGGGVWLFVAQLERLWNMPGRIRVESKRLLALEARYDRERWEELLAAAHAEEEYWRQRGSRRHPHRVAELSFRGVWGELRDAGD